MDRDGLWFKVLSSRYGEDNGRLKEGGRRGSVWWREIVKIQEGIGVEGGNWFEANVKKVVGNGFNTYFWSDYWVGSSKLMEGFRGLYDLSIHKDKTVGEMCALGWDNGGDAWGWRRRLLAWEEELMGELMILLANVSLRDSRQDVWLWRPNAGDGYTVCGVYQMLMRQDMHGHDDILDVVWHKSVPLKVSICVWRLIRNKWPTKDNLWRRGVIPLDSQLCVSCCGQNETATHLIIHCPTFSSLWQLVKNLIGVFSVDPQNVMDHFHQFIYSLVDIILAVLSFN